MGKGLTATLCLLMLAAAPARAADLQGQWQIAYPDNSYSAVVLIDSQGRITWDAVWKPRGIDAIDASGKAKSHGYVKITGSTIELILTNGIAVERVPCTFVSNDLLHCVWSREDGKPSYASLTRVGPGPKKLMPVLP